MRAVVCSFIAYVPRGPVLTSSNQSLVALALRHEVLRLRDHGDFRPARLGPRVVCRRQPDDAQQSRMRGAVADRGIAAQTQTADDDGGGAFCLELGDGRVDVAETVV